MAMQAGSAAVNTVSGKTWGLNVGKSGKYTFGYWCLLDVLGTVMASRNARRLMIGQLPHLHSKYAVTRLYIIRVVATAHKVHHTSYPMPTHHIPRLDDICQRQSHLSI